MSKSNVVVAASPEAAGLEHLLSYRLSIVANLLGRSQFLRFSPLSDISQLEWRLLVLVDSYGPLPVKMLSRHAGIDFGHTSRLVTRLHQDGYVAKGATGDGRSVSLSLTAKGRALHRKLWSIAMACNEEFLASLSGQQQKALYAALDTLEGVARAALEASAGKTDAGAD